MMMDLGLLQLSAPAAWAACLACLFLGAVFATLRSAFTLSCRAGMDRLLAKYPRAAGRLRRWADHWDVMRAALLISSMIMEVGAIAFGLRALTPAGPTVSLVDLAGVFFILLLFTITLEVLPRALSESYADRLTMFFLRPVTALAYATWVLAWPLARVDGLLRHRLMQRSDEEDRPTPEDAILHLVEKPETMDLDEDEAEIIRSVFEFGETITREIMTPRIDMEGLDDEMTVRECLDTVSASPYSRFPVYHGSLDDVRGAVHAKDLLRKLHDNQADQRVLTLARSIPFVPESMPINDLLRLFQTERAQMAVVVDEYGGTAGLVTIANVLKQLVGDILDEYDDKEKPVSSLSDGSIILSARVPVEEANDRLAIHIPVSDDYDSLGGFVFHALGRVPHAGESMTGPDFRITIQTANPRQIETVRIQKTAGPG